MFIHSQLPFCWSGQPSKWVYFNPFLSMQLSWLPDCAPLSLAHQSLIGFDCLCKEQPAFRTFFFSAFTLLNFAVRLLFLLLLIYGRNWHNLWTVQNGKIREKEPNCTHYANLH